MPKFRCRLSLHSSVAAAALIAFAAPVAVHAQTATYSFNIPAENLGAALRAFARVSGQQLVYDNALAKNKTSSALVGTYTPDEGLRTLLAGSGMSFRRGRQGEFMISEGTSSIQPQGVPGEPANTTRVQEVVVTGTHISGLSPTVPVTTIGRNAIDQSGYSTTGDLIRALPQSFGGGQNIGVINANGTENTLSSSDASTANLRGLGSESTLTLVDGRRLAYDTTTASTDISGIPLAAIQRVEIVTDGASALYGSDAIAGVVNFIMRKDYDGLQSDVTLGGATEGGGFEQEYSLLGGHTWSGGNILISYEYANQQPVDVSQRRYLDQALDGTYILPRTERNSIFASGNQNITPTLTFTAEGLYTSRTAADKLNYYGEEPGLSVDNNDSVEQYGVTAGLHANLPNRWYASLTGDLSRDRTSQLGTDLDLGADISQSTTQFVDDLSDVELQANGPILSLPSGDVHLAAGGGYRSESLNVAVSSAGSVTNHISGNRGIEYIYGELDVPIIPLSLQRAGLQSLDLDVSGRFEHYSDFGDTGNPRIALRYKPTPDISVTGSWGTSFRAPSLLQEHNSQSVLLYTVGDPQSSSGSSTILYQYGGNPQLRPETATSETVTAEYNPTFEPALHLKLSYFHIAYQNRIEVAVPNLSFSLTDPSYAGSVLRNPSVAQQTAAISAAQNFYNYTGSPYIPSNVSALVNSLYQNFASEDASGVDIDIDFTRQTIIGNLHFIANLAYLDTSQQLNTSTPTEQLSGTVFNPPRFRMRDGITWEAGPWSATAFVNYTGSSTDPATVPQVRIGSWTTIDGQISRRFTLGKYAKDMRIDLSVQNLFDQKPPYVAAADSALPGLNYDTTNASALGRFVSIHIVNRW